MNVKTGVAAGSLGKRKKKRPGSQRTPQKPMRVFKTLQA